MFEKIKEIYDSGNLVAEMFGQGSFLILASKDKVSLKNNHYGSAKPGGDNCIDLRGADQSAVLGAIGEWKKVRGSLWGRISCGHPMGGYQGSFYYSPSSKCPPDGKEAVWMKKDEKTGKASKPKDLGKLEERVERGNFEFVFERFCFGVGRGKQQVRFDEWQVPLIGESFILHEARKGLYAPSCFDGFGYPGSTWGRL